MFWNFTILCWRVSISVIYTGHYVSSLYLKILSHYLWEILFLIISCPLLSLFSLSWTPANEMLDLLGLISNISWFSLIFSSQLPFVPYSRSFGLMPHVLNIPFQHCIFNFQKNLSVLWLCLKKITSYFCFICAKYSRVLPGILNCCVPEVLFLKLSFSSWEQLTCLFILVFFLLVAAFLQRLVLLGCFTCVKAEQ